jgi:hypothetical protein
MEHSPDFRLENVFISNLPIRKLPQLIVTGISLSNAKCFSMKIK